MCMGINYNKHSSYVKSLNGFKIFSNNAYIINGRLSLSMDAITGTSHFHTTRTMATYTPSYTDCSKLSGVVSMVTILYTQSYLFCEHLNIERLAHTW